MRIVVDTREQFPLHFTRETVVRTLLVGDYGCEINGVLTPIFFERKSLGDRYGTMTSG